MVNNKIISCILLFLCFSCSDGAKVHFTKPQMEKFADGTIAEGVTTPVSETSGTLIRPSVNDGTDRIITGGRTYQVGKFSSGGAYSFIYSRPLGSSTPVKLKGSTKRDSGYAPNPDALIDVINLESLHAP